MEYFFQQSINFARNSVRLHITTIGSDDKEGLVTDHLLDKYLVRILFYIVMTVVCKKPTLMVMRSCHFLPEYISSAAIQRIASRAGLQLLYFYSPIAGDVENVNEPEEDAGAGGDISSIQDNRKRSRGQTRESGSIIDSEEDEGAVGGSDPSSNEDNSKRARKAIR